MKFWEFNQSTVTHNHNITTHKISIGNQLCQLNSQMSLLIDIRFKEVGDVLSSVNKEMRKAIIITVVTIIKLINYVEADELISDKELDDVRMACNTLANLIIESKLVTVITDDAILEIYKLSPKLSHGIYDNKRVLRKIKNLISVIFIEIFNVDINLKIH